MQIRFCRTKIEENITPVMRNGAFREMEASATGIGELTIG
jgi:hypothetical protein